MRYAVAEKLEIIRLVEQSESLNNLTPADVYSGRGPTVLSWRESVKLKTIEARRRLHLLAAKTSTQMNQVLS
jgi:hypothetical protein